MIVVLSGEIATGKTTVASELEASHGYRRVRSGTHLAEVAEQRGLRTDREGLQKMGDILDQETNGAWIARLANDQIDKNLDAKFWILDSARRDYQIQRFREVFGAHVVHVHLMAAEDTLKSRFQSRAVGDVRDEGADYIQVKASETEQHAKGLGAIADVCVNSGMFTPVQIARIIDHATKLRVG